MADVKISELIETEEINKTDYIPIVQNGITKKIQAQYVGTGGRRKRRERSRTKTIVVFCHAKP